MGSFAIVWVGLVFVALSGISFYVIPKTWDQTLWRTCLIMTYVCVYLMWAVTYMAQLHPLIAPQRSDLKIEH
ncbi:V-type proton ATPase subunit E [Dimargaris cristalligena]|uniref:V-type proton ATPase subunit E n=1 Tax=Dimargaris cristalligena TaxID=215637 RepID=A0A4Q0A197_9FUNG|nr:V-type proton ATPase subunit E [Dimargaris cristalligena]|eukprot:RKP39853.1 V-type proton ATPase subunit E [Dimargaris cristalligena]